MRGARFRDEKLCSYAGWRFNCGGAVITSNTVCHQFFFIIERTRDLIYLKFVATDFSPVLVKIPVTHRSPCYSAVSSLLMNPLPDRSNYSPLCHTHYLTPPDQNFTSLFRPDPVPILQLETILQSSMLQRFTAESSRELSALRKLNNKQRQV